MNWFEPVYQDMVPWGDHLLAMWALLSSALLTYAVTSLVRPAWSLRRRLLIGVVIGLLWQEFMPSRPLAFMDGRIGGLQDEVFLVIAMLLIGLYGIAYSFYRFRFRILVPAIATLVVGGLSYTYHIVLANGLDAVDRHEQAQELVAMLSLSNRVYREMCTLEIYSCGTGIPNTGHEIFDRELAAWIGNLPPGSQGYISSSNGAVTTNPTYIWAGEITDNGVNWIKKSYQGQTESLNFAFGIMLALASSFWLSAAVLAEYLHERQWRRRKQAQVDGNQPADNETQNKEPAKND